MAWYWWSLLLFVIGAVEHMFSEYENLVSVRLKVQQTVMLAEVNCLLDGIVYMITFSLFWKGAEEGHISYEALIPYFFYIQGCVLGTALALIYYKHKKQKQTAQKRLQHLEKARQIRKQLQTLEKDLNIEVEAINEAEFDETQEQERQDAPSTDIPNQTTDNGEPPKETEHKEIPPPQN